MLLPVVVRMLGRVSMPLLRTLLCLSSQLLGAWRPTVGGGKSLSIDMFLTSWNVRLLHQDCGTVELAIDPSG